jgi:hypothetical protein
MEIKKLLLTMMGVILLVGCEKEPCGCGNFEEQPVYFEYHYMNHAWGFQENGWLIDGAGIVKGFEYPEDFRRPDSTGLINYQDLVLNLRQTDTVLHHIDREELEAMVALIPAAAAGPVGEARSIAADAGGAALYAYLYIEEEDTYQQVFLGQSGDWEQTNQSPEAMELVAWLRQFGVFWLSE